MSHKVFMPPRTYRTRTASSSSGGTNSYYVRYTHLCRGSAHKSKSLEISEEGGRQQTAVTSSNCTDAFLRFKVIEKQLSFWKYSWLQVFHMAGMWGNAHIKIGSYCAERWSTSDIQNQPTDSDTAHHRQHAGAAALLWQITSPPKHHFQWFMLR